MGIYTDRIINGMTSLNNSISIRFLRLAEKEESTVLDYWEMT